MSNLVKRKSTKKDNIFVELLKENGEFFIHEYVANREVKGCKYGCVDEMTAHRAFNDFVRGWKDFGVRFFDKTSCKNFGGPPNERRCYHCLPAQGRIWRQA